MAEGKLYFGKIDVTKIDNSRLFKGEKGTYLDLTIWINEEEDKYGNTLSIQQSTKREEYKIYLGNGKAYKAGGVQVNNDEDSSGDLPF